MRTSSQVCACSLNGVASAGAGAQNVSSTAGALEHRMVRLGASAARHVVKAIVFYGRRGSVQMLNCYLERNLRRNGGLLSEVSTPRRSPGMMLSCSQHMMSESCHKHPTPRHTDGGAWHSHRAVLHA